MGGGVKIPMSVGSVDESPSVYSTCLERTGNKPAPGLVEWVGPDGTPCV